MRLFHPWGREPKGGWSGACVSVSHVVRHRQESGFDGLGWVTLGPVMARQGPVWVLISVVHQYGTVERSVRAHRGLSGHIGFRRFSVGTLIWHDRTRRGSTDRIMGPLGAPFGPDEAPADHWRRHRTPLNRRLPSLGGPQLLLAQLRPPVLKLGIGQ